MQQQMKELRSVCSGSATKLDWQVDKMASMHGQCDQLQKNFDKLQATIDDLEASRKAHAESAKLEAVQAAQRVETLQALIFRKNEELRLASQNLDVANSANTDLEKSLKIQAEFGKSEAAQALQKLESLRMEIHQKEEELRIADQSLDATNSAKTSFEIEKEKTMIETQSLLRRVQEGECWLKTIRETAARFTAMDSDEPFWHIWSRLETILQSTAAEAQRQAPGSSTSKDVGTGSGEIGRAHL